MMTVVKTMLPGTLPSLLAALAAGLALLRWPRTQAWGRRWLLGLLALYALFSVPAGSRIVAAPLGWGIASIERAADARGAGVVVVLDGGSDRSTLAGRTVERVNGATALRALEVLRVAALLDKPLIVVSGGTDDPRDVAFTDADALRQMIVRGGIPPDRVVLDSTSLNTRAHACILTKWLRDHGTTAFVLVTSATHIRRAAAAFRAAGATPVPSAAPVLDERLTRGWDAFWPTEAALTVSVDAMHDYVGLLYYWARGWT